MNEYHDPYRAPGSVLEVSGTEHEALRPAGKWRRLGTNLIDSFCFYLLLVPVAIVLILAVGEQRMLEMTSHWMANIVSLALFVVYYVVFEFVFGRTPGKWVCGTKVVDEGGGAPRLGQVVGRSFARLVPFEPFSLLFSPDDERTGWHDRWPHTRVVLVPGRG